MIVRLTSTVTPQERDAVLAAVVRLGVAASEVADGVQFDGALAADDAQEIAALPGVAAIEAGDTLPATRREVLFDWIAGAAAILGVLVILAANFPAPLGLPADPLRTPAMLKPTWPMLAWYAAADGAPSWFPVPLLLGALAVLLLLWPVVARRFAESRPRLHTALGVAVLLAVAALAATEALR